MNLTRKSKKTFIIAEAGNNHEGNLPNAKKLVNLAAKAGVDAIKFQTFLIEKFINKKDKKRFKQLKKFQLSFNQFKQLKNLANKKKLKFISTPLDIFSAKFLIKNSDIIKIASSDNNFFPLLDVVLKSNKPIIISTGMTNYKELSHLIKYIVQKIGTKKTREKIFFLHCVTSYPAEDKFINLNSIPYLINKTKLKIGYSDHSLGFEACLGAVSLGAKIIEKHFTTNKKLSKFRDHAISADFNELKLIVKGIRKIENQLGKLSKDITRPEKKFLKMLRRAPYTKKNLKKGTKVTVNNIEFLRNTNSSNFLNLKGIIGKKIKKDLKKNMIINKDNLI